MEQYDLFGGVSTPYEPPRATNRLRTMQEQNGELNGQTCGGCGHLLTFDYHNRVYRKCELWRVSHSAVTDIRLKSMAYKKWIPNGEV